MGSRLQLKILGLSAPSDTMCLCFVPKELNVAEANSVGLKMKFLKTILDLKTIVLKCETFNLKNLNELRKNNL